MGGAPRGKGRFDLFIQLTKSVLHRSAGYFNLAPQEGVMLALRGSELTRRRIAIGRDSQRIKADGIRDRRHFRPRVKEGATRPTRPDPLWIFAGINRIGQRVDRPMKDQHQSRSILRRGDIAARLDVLRAGEAALVLEKMRGAGKVE